MQNTQTTTSAIGVTASPHPLARPARLGRMSEPGCAEAPVAVSARAPKPIAAPIIRLAVYDSLSAIEPIWMAFEQSADHTFFQTFAWLSAWHRNVGIHLAAAPVIVTGTHPDGTLLFVLPLAIERHRGVRVLTFLGSDLCDYNAPLLNSDFPLLMETVDFARLWSLVLDTVRKERRFAFDMAYLVKMPERIGRQANPFMALPRVPNPSGAYVTALGTSWDEFYKLKRSASTRKKERSQLRQLGEFGTVRFVDQLEGDERTRTLDVLFAQKALSFTRMGVRNVFSRPGHRELFTEFVMDPRSRHLVHLSRYEIGETIAAASIGLTSAGCYSLVISSYESAGDMARHGPGRAHMNELLGYSIGRGFHTFDFTIGDESYKRDWSDTRLTLYDHMSAATPVGLVALAGVGALRAIKHSIKQNPILWRQFSRARSYLGRLRSRPANRPRPPNTDDDAGSAARGE